MEKQLSLSLPGFGKVQTPENIPSGANAPADVIQTAFSLLFIVGIIAALIFLIYGGILWVTSSGDKTKIDKARQTIIFSIIGLIVMLLAFIIIQVIGTVLGSSYLSNFGL